MRLGSKLAIAFVLALTVIGVVGIQSYLSVQELSDRDHWVAHTHEVIANLDHVLSVLTDAEARQQGFILTGDDSYLEHYNSATAQVQQNIDSLTSLTADNPDQQRDIRQLQRLTAQKLDELAQTIKLRKDGQSEAALATIRAGSGKRIMDDIRKLIEQMETRERQLLDQRAVAAAAVERHSTATVGAGMVLSLLVLAIAAVIVTRTMGVAIHSIQPSAAGRRWPRIVGQYVFAAAVIGLATLLRSWLLQFGPMPTFITFYPAILIVASIGGGGPGIAATLLSALVVDYFFMQPTGAFKIGAANDAIALGIFLGASLFLCVLAERLRRARWNEAVGVTQDRERQWLRVTMTSIGDAVLATDKAGNITLLNPVAEDLTGWREAQAIGQPAQSVFRIVNEKTQEPSDDIVARVLREGKTIGLANHTAVIRRDGRQTPIEDSAAPIKDKTGAVIGAVLVFHDVTEKRRAQEALRESEQRIQRKLMNLLSPEGDISSLELGDLVDVQALQSLMEEFYKLADLPMALIDVQGKVLVGVGWQRICTEFHRVHPVMCKHCVESDTELTTGVPAGEFRVYKCKSGLWDVATPVMVGGRHLGNLFTGQLFFDDETVDREAFRRQASQYGLDEAAYMAALDNVPKVSRQKVKTGMAFLSKLAQSLSQLTYSNVKLARLLVERDNLVESVRRSESLLRTVMDNSPDPIFLKDRDSRMLMANPATLVAIGKPADAVVGKTDAEFYDDPAVGRAMMDNDKRIIDSDQTQVTEEMVPSANGPRTFLTTKSPCHDGNGQIIGVMGLSRDITDRKRAEEALHKTVDELRRSNQELEQFAYIASHDMQEPLRQVRSFTQLLDTRYGQMLDGKAKEYMQFITEGASRMSGLVQDLLAYSRVGAREVRRQPMACQKALDRALANLEMSVTEAHAKVTHDELPTVTAEPTQLTQLFQNLIGNAIKFHRDGVAPAIHVGCRRDGPNWLFQVRDNGIGIDPQYHQKVFLIFQRLHGRSKYAGTGIGLAICKKIVEQHGGEIWIESQAGQGTTFCFTMPAEGQ